VKFSPLRFNCHDRLQLYQSNRADHGRLVFAETLAARGAHLLLLARSGAVLDSLAKELSQRHGIRAHALVADLSLPGAAAQAHAQTCALGMPPDVLINNAGFATHGRFKTIALARQAAEVTVNCTALMELTHCALPRMLALDRGRSSHVAGRPNRLLAWLPRLLPRQTVLGIVEGMLKPKAA